MERVTALCPVVDLEIKLKQGGGSGSGGEDPAVEKVGAPSLPTRHGEEKRLKMQCDNQCAGYSCSRQCAGRCRRYDYYELGRTIIGLPMPWKIVSDPGVPGDLASFCAGGAKTSAKSLIVPDS